MKNFLFVIININITIFVNILGDFYISSSGNSWPDLNASIGSGWKFGV